MSTETAKFFQTEHIDEIFNAGQVIVDGVPLPLEIEISLVDSCTRACFCCPRGMEDIAPKTNLALTPMLYKKLASELKELGYKGLIMLSGFGESLLHPDLYNIVKEFSFTYVDMNTNGDLLTREKIEKLIESGINKIMVSVYEKDKMQDFEEMSRGYENHVILRNRYENYDRLFNNRGGAVYKSDGKGICYYPFYLLMVDSNGDIYPCCHEWQRRLIMGNLYQMSLFEIWTSKEIKRVRKKILEGNRDVYPCRICNVNGTYRGGNNFALHSQLC